MNTQAPADRAAEIQRRLAEGLGRIDPHHRLAGRPVTYRVLDGRTFEITYRDVAGVSDAELTGIKHMIGVPCSWFVSPQTAETLTIRFVVQLV